MPKAKSVNVTDTEDGLPRRRAIQGIAGSLAGIAALGAVNASAKNKNKKKKSKNGILVRVELQEAIASTEPVVGSLATATATCPAAGANEQVFALGGGYSINNSTVPVDISIIASEPTNNGRGWTATVRNDVGLAKTITTTAVCAYFKTK